jgi:hypothetical protein
MDALLAHVLDAHGGLDRWSGVQALTARVSIGGPFWGLKGWPDIFVDETVDLDAQREHVVFTPLGQADRSSVFDVDPERIVVRAAEGAVVERRDDPRASFAGFDTRTRWDLLQVGYFTSYALWNYLTTPFMFTYPGVHAREIEPWQEHGETWRRLQVTFPPSIATHNPEQVFYYGADGMQRRMDYAPEVNGDALVAHYTDEARSFGGVVYPTRRRVFGRDPDGSANQSVAFITIDIDDVELR